MSGRFFVLCRFLSDRAFIGVMPEKAIEIFEEQEPLKPPLPEATD